MSTIAEKLKTTYLGLAGLTTSMRQLLSVGAKEVTSQEINSKLDGVAKEESVKEILEEVSGMGAVANELQSGKQAIVDAINHMGGEATEGNTLTDLANKIRDLDVVSNECVLVDDTQKPINIGNVVAMDKIEEIHDNSSTTLRRYAFYHAKNLKKVTFEKVTQISSYAFNGSGLQEAYFQSATDIAANSLQNTPLRVLYAPIVTSTNSGAFEQGIAACSNLIDLFIGKNFISNFSVKTYYNPGNAMSKTSSSLCFDTDINNYGRTFTSNWEKWKWCIINHWAANLRDLKNTSPLTISLHDNVLSKFDDEMIAAFTNKNWNLA